MILLSIITVTKNNSAGLSRTLDSCRQLLARDDVEIVIVDGGSTDDTVVRIDSWRSNMPSARCVFKTERDTGIYDAMNKGLAMATGRHVVFMNSGDTFAPELALNPTEFDAATVYYGGARFDSPQGGYRKSYSINSVVDFLNHNAFCHQALYYPVALVRSLGGYDLSFKVSADFDLTLRCFNRAPFKSLDKITCVCELGGFSHVHGWRSYKERMRSVLANTSLCWWCVLAIYAPVFYLKHRIVKALDGSPLLMRYRRFRYGD